MNNRQQLRAIQDHTTQNLKFWWRNATQEDKGLLEAEIKRLSEDSVKGVLGRFAQLGYTQLALESLNG